MRSVQADAELRRRDGRSRNGRTVLCLFDVRARRAAAEEAEARVCAADVRARPSARVEEGEPEHSDVDSENGAERGRQETLWNI